MATVREVFRARLDRLQQRKAQLMAEALACQAQIDNLQALRASLTVDHEALLQLLQEAGVVRAED
jgi:response regulator of citrate/malate metabolism